MFSEDWFLNAPLCLDPLWDIADWPTFKLPSSTNCFSVKFQTTLNQIQEESEDPRDICIDQGFTFTHTPLLSLAVIQGLFGLASNSCSTVGCFIHTQGCISNETPMASQHPLSLTFLMFQLQDYGTWSINGVYYHPVNMYVFTNTLLKCDHVMSSFLCRLSFTVTRCFQSVKYPASKACSFTLCAVSLSSTGMLTAGRFFLATWQMLSSSLITKGPPRFMSPCLFPPFVWISHLCLFLRVIITL